MKILPGEYHVREGGGIIKTRCPYNLITDVMIVQEARRANLAAGDFIIVQCMDNPREAVLQEAEYRVMSRKDTMESTTNFRGDVHQAEVARMSVERKVDWWPADFKQPTEPVPYPETPQEMAEAMRDKPRRGRPPKAA